MSARLGREVEAFVAEREIKFLMHFTRLQNLNSILAKGLIPRNKLENQDGCNDGLRLDGTDAVCASIEFPNYQMFYRFRKENPEIEWVILVINASVLWTTRVAFCQSNAASNLVTDIPIGDRMAFQAFRAMYDNFGEKMRVDLNIPVKYPTHPQAEVLLFDGVPRSAILGVIVEKDALKHRLEAAYPGVIVKTIPRYFSFREDFKHWKKVVA